LAFQVGNTGPPNIAHRLLQPLLTTATLPDTRQLAEWILDAVAVAGPRADLRLYLSALQHQRILGRGMTACNALGHL
jgi:hypothetical protein